jgi:glycerophosphoryl diester phosphodiesterase
LIIGHRGNSTLAPENTLAAFAQAMREGADGIEFDVRLTMDNLPVVIHDASLERTANLNRAVAELSSAELGDIDVGSWFNRKFSHLARSEYEVERIPPLKALFDFFSSMPGLLYLEMKCEDNDYKALTASCVDLINQYSFRERTVVLCFDLTALAAVKRLDPRIRTGALFEPRLKQPISFLKKLKLLEKARDIGAEEIALHHTLVTQRVVDKALEAELACVVWTVDHPRWVNRANKLGLKALMTNNPALMLRAISSS